MLIVRAILALLFISLAGCSSYNLKLQAGKYANTDGSGKPVSLALHIYQLTSAAEFQQATFRQLFFQPEQTLKMSLLREKKIFLAPGAERDLKLRLDRRARYLGVVADYRLQGRLVWRRLINVGAFASYFGGSHQLLLGQEGVQCKHSSVG